MFGSNKRNVSDGDEIQTIIGKDTVFKGNITSKCTMRVDGQFEGDINTTGNLLVGANAIIRANVTALNATIAGTIYGNVDITEKFELMSSAKIYGDIKTETLTVSPGAIFKGACEMHQAIEESEGTIETDSNEA